MRGSAALLVLALLAAGCGAAPRLAQRRATVEHASQPGLRVGVVGGLQVSVAGAAIEGGTLAGVADDALVVVPAGSPAAARLASVAVGHPSTHFALVGASAAALHLPNVAGMVIRDDQAALLGGVVAGLVAVDAGGGHRRVAWAGPHDPAIAAAFARGVHRVDGGFEILTATSPDTPAACKEAAIGAVDRGALVVMAGRGSCARAAVAGAHEQNVVALRLSDFELRRVVAAQVIRNAVAGVYRGGEDVIFGAASGAVGVGSLDPRIPAAVALEARTAAQQLAAG